MAETNGTTATAGRGDLILGVDVGGTFTDGLLLDPRSGELRRAKVPTTPEDQSEGTLATLPQMGAAASELSAFCHGTTVGINAFLQRRGAKTGLLCTEGMRDILDIGGFTREPDGLYDAEWTRPHQERPIVHRRHIREVTGRMLYDGEERLPIDEEQIVRELEFLRDEGVEAIAVCLLHAYVDLQHEERIVELIREVMPDCYVQSSAVRPVVGEYTRTTAAVLDAYTGPIVSRYLRRLGDRLREQGYEGPAVIMQMNGGVRTLERTSAHFPAYTMLSGPVAGLLGAEYYAQNFLDVGNLVCIDIGGTSTDLGLVIDDHAQTVPEWEAEWRLPLGVPAVDVRSIGAGGGSLIQADEMGTLRVGPESAGAVPGPVSYRRGGELPTITDAHVMLGTIRPAAFLGGRMELDVDGARGAIGELAGRLAMDPTRLAAGALQLMNANIESEISKMVFERGVDLRSFALFAYGGAGAVHAVDVARSAGIREVIVPQHAGGFSALGLVTAPPKVERALSRVESLDDFSIDELVAHFERLEDEVVADLGGQGVAVEEIQVTRSIAAMYTGQGFSNELPLTEWPLTAAAIERWKQQFDELYDRLYGYSAPEMGITVTTLTAVGLGPRASFNVAKLERGEEQPPEAALDGVRMAQFSTGRPVETRFFARDALLAGNRIEGPAVIEDEMTTIAVPGDAVAGVDDFGNVRIVLNELGKGGDGQ
jgi:N-methylhydantoinase A